MIYSKILFVTVFLLSAGILLAENVKESYHIPISSDFENSFNSSMVIEFTSKVAEVVALEKIDDNKHDEMLTAFKSFLIAVEKNSFDNVSFAVDEKADDLGNTALVKLNFIAKRYPYIKKQGPLLLVKRIIGNNQEAFLWGVKMPDGKYLTAATLFTKRDGKIFWDWSSHNSTLGIVCSMLRENELSPADKGVSYNFSLTPNDRGSTMITFKFNGKRANINTEEPVNSSLDRIEKFYIEAVNGIHLPLEQYADFYTAKSRKKILDYYEKDPEMLSYRRRILKERPRIVYFILDAAPVYIVFYNVLYNTNKSLLYHYDYIVDTPSGLKLTNFNYSDSFNAMLQDNKKEIEKIVYPEGLKDVK